MAGKATDEMKEGEVDRRVRMRSDFEVAGHWIVAWEPENTGSL